MELYIMTFFNENKIFKFLFKPSIHSQDSHPWWSGKTKKEKKTEVKETLANNKQHDGNRNGNIIQNYTLEKAFLNI